MVSVGCSRGSNSGLNLTQFQILVCVCVSLVLSLTVSSFLRYFSHNSVFSITLTYLSNSAFLLCTLLALFTQIPLSFHLLALSDSYLHCSPLFPLSSPLSLLSAYIYLLPTITFSSHSVSSLTCHLLSYYIPTGLNLWISSVGCLCAFECVKV